MNFNNWDEHLETFSKNRILTTALTPATSWFSLVLLLEGPLQTGGRPS